MHVHTHVHIHRTANSHRNQVDQKETYRKISNISRTKSQNLNDSLPALQLSLPDPLKLVTCINSRNEDVSGAAPTAMLQP